MGLFMSVALFRNATQHLVGVSFRDEDGNHVGECLRPGDEVYLSEAQQRQIARAPRRAEDNPFANGSLVLVAMGADVDAARPIGSVAAPEPARTPPAASDGTPGDDSVPSVAGGVVSGPEGDGVEVEQVGVLTREYLEGQRRSWLNGKAKALGVKSPDQLGNKGEVIDAILAGQA